MPYSDPLADGPVIQAAATRALAAGATLDKVLQLVKEVRPQRSRGCTHRSGAKPRSPACL